MRPIEKQKRTRVNFLSFLLPTIDHTYTSWRQLNVRVVVAGEGRDVLIFETGSAGRVCDWRPGFDLFLMKSLQRSDSQLLYIVQVIHFVDFCLLKKVDDDFVCTEELSRKYL